MRLAVLTSLQFLTVTIVLSDPSRHENLPFAKRKFAKVWLSRSTEFNVPLDTLKVKVKVKVRVRVRVKVKVSDTLYMHTLHNDV